MNFYWQDLLDHIPIMQRMVPHLFLTKEVITNMDKMFQNTAIINGYLY